MPVGGVGVDEEAEADMIQSIRRAMERFISEVACKAAIATENAATRFRIRECDEDKEKRRKKEKARCT